ncbi:unnamed protein product [Meloidogyne enterolobii]|uniref:Uncharacterized protein n=1 Tax=Meloidogyne enterolobii TaxID=390850 RepID=A0ACB1B2G5_MELEN
MKKIYKFAIRTYQIKKHNKLTIALSCFFFAEKFSKIFLLVPFILPRSLHISFPCSLQLMLLLKISWNTQNVFILSPS